MNPAMSDVWKDIIQLARCALSHANRHALYQDRENGKWHELCVLQAAHAAELFIKARIAQEHPLLMFDKLPKAIKTGSRLTLDDLARGGRTHQWSELPQRLRACTGVELPDVDRFVAFGQLRNRLQHFSVAPGVDASGNTIEFVFGVIDPFIQECWGLYAIDHDEDYDPHIYLVRGLIHREIPFLVSPEAAERWNEWEVDWSEVSDDYKRYIRDQICVHGYEIEPDFTYSTST